MGGKFGALCRSIALSAGYSGRYFRRHVDYALLGGDRIIGRHRDSSGIRGDVGGGPRPFLECILMLPVASAGIWLGSVLWGLATADRSGMAAPFLSGWLCFPCTALLGFMPALVMMTMLRRGALLIPYLNTGLGGLAAASLGVTALRFAQPIDDPLMVLAWQGGTVALLAFAASLCGAFLSRSFQPTNRHRQNRDRRRRDNC